MKGWYIYQRNFFLTTFQIPNNNLLMQKESIVEEEADQKPQV